MISEINLENFIALNYPTIPELILNEKGVYEKNLSFIRIKNTLQKIQKFESDNNKPFEQFSQLDFIKLFEESNWTAINTFVSNKSVIKEFADWYFETIIGLGNIPFGHSKISPIKHIELEDVSSDERYKREYFKDADDFFSTLEEMFGSLESERYAMNLVFFTLMWESLNREEICFLKQKDIKIGKADEFRLALKLKTREIIVTEPRSVKIIKRLMEDGDNLTGYEVLQSNGSNRSFKYANTNMLLRNTSIKPVSNDHKVPGTTLNKYCLEQTVFADNLPEDNKYHGKRLVHRGISDSAAFLRLLNMNVKGKLHNSDISNAKRVAIISGGTMRSFGENFRGWKEYFGH